MIFLFFTDVLALYNETWNIMCKAFSNRQVLLQVMYLKRKEQNKTTLKMVFLCFLMTDGETVCNKPNYWLLFDMLFTVNVRGSFDIHVRFNIPKIKTKTLVSFLTQNPFFLLNSTWFIKYFK